MEKPLVDGKYRLKKFHSKGGWTYAEIPDIKPDKNNPFGWVVVKGRIDDYCLDHYKLMPMGSGKLFLPVKASIRRKIGKEEGDIVHIVLYPESRAVDLPQEIKDCFVNEPKESLELFMSFSDSEKKSYLDWIYGARSLDKKAARIAFMLERLSKGLKFHDRSE